ncbi:MAG: Transcriptional regulator, AsnC family, partial [uncultured Nocardioidaceae bacterium]
GRPGLHLDPDRRREGRGSCLGDRGCQGRDARGGRHRALRRDRPGRGPQRRRAGQARRRAGAGGRRHHADAHLPRGAHL